MDKIKKQYKRLSSSGKDKFDKINKSLKKGQIETLSGQKLKVSTSKTAFISVRLTKKERAIILLGKATLPRICLPGNILSIIILSAELTGKHLMILKANP